MDNNLMNNKPLEIRTPDLIKDRQEDLKNTPRINPDLIREFYIREEIVGQGEKIGTKQNQELLSAQSSSLVAV